MSTLYRGGVVQTHRAGASAVVIDGGRIVWLGTDDEAERHTGAVDAVVELEGALVTPGFVDAHVHLSQTGAGLRGVDLSTARSAQEALNRIAAHVRVNPGRPVFAANWEELDWPEGRTITSTQLDRAADGQVVYALRIDGHSAVVSSALAAVSGAAELPGWGGDGLVTRDAHHAARDAYARSVSPSQRREDIDLALAAAAAAGIVCVHENAGPHVSSADDLADVLAAGSRTDTPEVVGYWAEIIRDEQQARNLAAVHQVAGIAGDLNADGSVGSRTAHLQAPYADDERTRGHAFLTRGEIRDHVVGCTLAGLQAGFHVIGDAAVGDVITGLADAARITGAEAFRSARHRLEHVEMLSPTDVLRLADLGVVASVQPAFDAFWGGAGGMYETRLGADRARGMNPFGAMLRAGVPLALGSDSPVTPFAPWEAVRACVQHHDPEQSLSPIEAFRAHSAGGWYAARLDGRGRIAVGERATFVVWDAPRLAPDDGDPVLPDLTPGIPAPVARTTLVNGVTVHDVTR